MTITSPVPGYVTTKTPQLEFSATGTGNLVKIDGSTVDKASGDLLGPLAEGSHLVRVESTDALGDSGFAEVAILVDTVAPTARPATRKISAKYHTLEIKSDGSLWSWGANWNGQLGDGSTVNRSVPVQVGKESRWLQVAAGEDHSLALREDGTLWAWGYNGRGQLGTGDYNQVQTPVQVGADSDWAALAAGRQHSLGLKKDGSLWAWGYNGNGQIGDGSYDSYRLTPVQIGQAGQWKAVAAGDSCSLALKADGTLWTWGYNGDGQLGTGGYDQSRIPVQVGSDADWSLVGGGYSTSYALKTDGTLWVWGYNGYGQYGNGSYDASLVPVQSGSATDWVALAAGDYHVVALKQNGEVWAWGNNDDGELGDDSFVRRTSPVQVGAGSVWSAIAAGAYHSLAVTATGELFSWGYNYEGELGNGSRSDRSTPGAVIDRNSGVAINGRAEVTSASSVTLRFDAKDDNGVAQMQFSNDGENWSVAEGYSSTRAWDLTPGDGTKTVLVRFSDPAGNWSAPFGASITLDSTAPSPPVAASLAASYYHALFLTTQGTLSSWGVNWYGQLGDGTGNGHNAPVQVGLPNSWSAASAGYYHSLAARADGTLWAWGDNGDGQLGTGDYNQSQLPVQVGSDRTWSGVVAGYYHSLGLKNDGTLWAWGANWEGMLGDGTSNNRIAPIQVGTTGDWKQAAAGEYNSYALKRDGTLWAWGYNGYGQLGTGNWDSQYAPAQVGTGSDWIAVAAGQYHALALKSDGTLWAWGNNDNGQLGTGGTSNQTAPVQVGSDSDWSAVAAGSRHSLAVKSNGTLWSWGANDSGQLGDGTGNRRLTPVRVGTLGNWKGVAGGMYSSYGTTQNGSLWAWGNNNYGQLGDGSWNYQYAPVLVTSAQGVTVIGGQAGGAELGPVGLTARASVATAIQAGSAGELPSNVSASPVVQLRLAATDLSGVTGMQLSNGNDLWSETLGYATRATWFLSEGDGPKTVFARFQDAAGNWSAPYSDTVVLDSTAPAVAIGSPAAGTTGDNTPALVFTASDATTSVVSVSVMVDGMVVQKQSGASLEVLDNGTHTVRVEALDQAGNLGVAETVFTVDAVAPVVSIASPVAGVGSSRTPQLLYSASVPDVVVLLDGVAIQKVSGDLFDALSDGPHLLRVEATDAGGNVGYANLTFIVDTTAPAPAPAVIRSAGGYYHSLALKGDGTLWAWGYNGNGQLGIGSYDSPPVPVQVGGAEWKAVAAGSWHSLAVKRDGTLWAWGNNGSGQLGDGGTNESIVPLQVGTDTGWVEVAAGEDFSLGLKADGTLWSWGNNGNGQLGDGSWNAHFTPVMVGGDSDWAGLAARRLHALALKKDGTLWGWGENGSGQVGDGTQYNSVLAPVRIGGDSDWQSVACGADHSLALKKDGSLWGWGSNGYGQVGDATWTTRLAPVRVGSDTDWSALCAGYRHSLAVKKGGTLWGWGENGNAQLGTGNYASTPVPVRANEEFTWSTVSAGDFHSLGAKADGSLWAWGYNGYGQVGDGSYQSRVVPVRVTGAYGIVINGGDSVANSVEAGLTLDARDLNGVAQMQLSNDGQNWTDPESYATARSWTLTPGPGLKTVSVRFRDVAGNWSEPFSDSITLIDAAPIAVSIGSPSAGFTNNRNPQLTFSVASGTATVRVDGAVVNTPSGGTLATLADGQHTIRVDARDAAGNFGSASVIVTVDTSAPVVTLTSPAPATNSATPQLAFSVSDGSVVVKLDGAVVAKASGELLDPLADGKHRLRIEATDLAGNLGSAELEFAVDTKAPAASGAPQVAAGVYHSVAVKSDGTLWAWGYNGYGQLGDGSTGYRYAPVQIGKDSPWLQVAAGSYHTLAVRGDGTLWSWGRNYEGELGDGSTSVRYAPVKVGTASDWVAVAAGEYHSLGLKRDGTLWAWGYNYEGELGDGTTQNRTTPVQVGSSASWAKLAAGSYHSLALKTDGTLWGWGGNWNGQLGDGTNQNRLSPVQIGSDNAWTGIAGGAAHSLGLKSGGTVWSWGYNGYYQLGDSTYTDRWSPVKVGTDNTWSAVAAGDYHSLALRADGSAWGWGNNGNGQLGDGGTSYRSTPVRAGTGNGWTSIAGGNAHTLAGQGDGSVWAWGYNGYGQLGDGGTNQRYTPGLAARGNGFTINGAAPAVATRNVTLNLFVSDVTGVAEMRFSNDGVVWADPVPYAESFAGWTLSEGDGTKTVQARFKDRAGNWSDSFSASILLDTTPPAITITSPASGSTGDNTPLLSFSAAEGTPVVKLDGAVIAKISGQSLEVLDNGTHTVRVESADALGNLGVAQVTFTVTASYPSVSIASPAPGVGNVKTPQLNFSASADSVAVKVTVDGGVVAKVSGDQLAELADGEHLLRIEATDANGNVGYATTAFTVDTTPPALEPGVVRFANGRSFTLALKGDGTLWSWGYNGYGQLGDGTWNSRPTPGQVGTSNDWKSVTAGGSHTLALKADGTLWGWGYNGNGELGDGSTSYRISPVEVGAGEIWQAVSAGANHTLALKRDGTLWAWGYNGYGQLGDGSTTSRSTPVQVGSTNDFVALAAGYYHSLALKSDGTLWSWGYNGNGELGAGTTTNRSTPVQVGSAKNWKALAAGDNHTLAVRDDGTLWAWGYNYYGQLGDGSSSYRTAPTRVGSASDWAAVAAGALHSAAVKKDGTLWAWGYNGYGQLGNGGTSSSYTPTRSGTAANWVSVGASYYQTSASTSDGTLWTWGNNGDGQLGDGTYSNRTTPGKLQLPAGTASYRRTQLINSGAFATDLKDVTLSFDASDLHGVASMQFSNDGALWSDEESYAGSKSWTLSDGDGEKTVYLRFKDSVGNWSQPYFDTIVLDTTLPAVSITSPSGAVGVNNPQLAFSVSEGTALVKLDGVVIGKRSGERLDPLSDGSHLLRVETRDAAGHTAFAEASFSVDAPPVTSAAVACTLDPDGFCSSAATVTLTTSLSSSQGTFYSLDGTSWLGYSGPFTLDNDGIYTVSFRSVDPGGLEEVAQTRTVKINKSGLVGLWRMDGNWLDASVLGRNGVVPANGPAFTENAKVGSNAGSFDGQNDYLEVLADVPEQNFTIEMWAKTDTSGGLFSVNGGNFAGNNGHDRHLYVNSSGYACFRVYQGSGWCTSTKVNDNFWHHWALTVQTGVGQKVYLDGQLAGSYGYDRSDFNWQDRITIGYSADQGYFKGLIDEVAIYNRPLTESEIRDYFTAYSLDAPTVAGVSPVVTSAELLLAGTKPANSGIQINGVTVVAADANTTWQASYTLSAGANTLNLRSFDSLRLSRTVAINVALDNGAPAVTGSVPANGSASRIPVASATISMTDSYSDLDLAGSVAGATVTLNGASAVPGAWSTSGTGKSGSATFTPLSAFSEGTYSITLNPRDIHGNTQAATVSFLVDSVPPAAPSFDALQQPIRSRGITLSGTKSSDSTQVTLSAPGASSYPVSYPSATAWQVYIYNLREGDNTVTAQAFDAAGNPSQTASLSLAVDTVAPATPMVNGVTSPTKNVNASLSGSKEAGSYLYVNGGATDVPATDTTWSYQVNLREGSNSFGIQARDAAGNQSSTVTVAVVRDTTAPSIAASLPANNAVVANADSVSITLIDPSSEADIPNSLAGALMKDPSGAVAAGTWKIVGTSIVFVPSQQPLAEGLYSVTLYPTDVLGNKGSVSFSFIVDRAAPTATGLTMNPQSPQKAGAVAFSVAFSEQMDTSVQPTVTYSRGFFSSTYSVTGGWVDAQTWRGSSTFSAATGDGSYTVKVKGAQDKARNVMADQELGSFVIDTTPPAAPTVAAVSTPTKVASQLVTGTKPADTAVVINGVVRVPLSAATDWSYSYPLSEGENLLIVLARDKAGNDSPALSPAPRLVLDTTPPVFTVDSFQTPAPTALQTLSGKKEPGCLVKLNGATIISAADQGSVWSYEVSLTEGTTNHLVFSASDALGNLTSRSVDILYDISAPAPLAAGMLLADGSGKGREVTLSWPSYPELQDLAYYRIYQASADFSSIAGKTPVGTVTKGTRSFKVANLVTGTAYFFAVVPVDQSGNAELAVRTAQAIPSDSQPPEEVSGLSAFAGYAAAGGNRVTLNWTASADSAGDLADQVLYLDDGKGYDAGTSLGKAVTSFIRQGLLDATAYKFKITTKDQGGRESAGVVVQAVTRLANPTGLTQTPGNQKVSLSWSPVASPYLKSYNIYRLQGEAQQTDSTAMTLIRSQSGTSYTDSGLTNGTTYQYAVTVLNSSGVERTQVQSVAAVPRSDTAGPVISGASPAANQVLSAPVTVSATAQDAESSVARMEIHIDGLLVSSQNGASISYRWDVADASDGPHTVKFLAFDTLENASQLSLPVTVSLAPPAVPVITTSFSGPITQTTVNLAGTAAAHATLTLRVNGAIAAATATGSEAGSFAFSGITLKEGDNLIAVKAGNRSGESAFSRDLKVTVDTGPPPAPTALAVKALTGGALQFSWQQGVGEAPTGFNLYQSAGSFGATTDPGVTRVNSGAIAYLLTEQIPADDSPRYYAVTALDGAGNQSPLSNLVAIAADRAAPSLSELKFALASGQPAADGSYGPGAVQVGFSVSEQLKEAPFFSLEPKSGSPVVVTMTALDATHYQGSFTLDAGSPHGTTSYKFSARDLIGNRGSSTGSGPTFDVRGPAATLVAPLKAVKSSGGPLAVAIVLDEPSVSAVALELRPATGASVPVTALSSTDNGTSWSGTLDPSSLPEGNAQFYLTAAQDRFGNTASPSKVGAALVVYASTPPAPAVPTGLVAKGAKGGLVKLSWAKSQDASGYRLYRRLAGEATPSAIASFEDAATLAFEDQPASEGNYLYALSAVGLLGSESERSAEVAALSDRSAPEAPSGLTLSLTGNGVKAEWQPAASGSETPATYRLYRAAGVIGETATLTRVVEVKQGPATDTAPDSSRRFYAVTALDAVGNESAPSGSQEIFFPVAPVRNMVLTRVDSGKPSLSWEAGEPNLLGYHIYRNGSRVTQTPTLSTSYSDGYYAGGPVSYGVSALNALGTESPVKEAALPLLSLGLKEGTALHRGVLETAQLVLSTEAGATELDSVSLKIGSLPESVLPGPFTVEAGQAREIAKVAATDSAAPPQVAVIATATLVPAPGTTVRITKSSMASVLSSGTALEIYNEPLKRGTLGRAKLKVNNLGSATSEFLTSEQGGATQHVTVYLKDQDGNTLAQGHLQQRTGAVVNAGPYAVARIEPGGSFLSDPIEFLVPATAPDKVVLEAQIDTLWYHYGDPDQVTAPGLRQNLNATIVDVPYTALAQTAKSVYQQGEPIVITGQALASDTGQPVASVPVRIGLSVSGFDRFYTVTTDLDGAFRYTFTPASNETGTYSLWAANPELTDRTVQAQFSIIGLSVTPDFANVRMVKNKPLDLPVTLKNLSSVELTGLTFSASSSAGLDVEAINPGSDTLAGGQAQNIVLRLTPQSDAPDTASASLVIATSQGVSEKVTLNVVLMNAIPVISTSPSYIDTGIVRGLQKVVTFRMDNTGIETLKNPRIEGPSLPWVTLTADRNLGDLPAGQGTGVGLLIKPGDSVQQGVYDDRLTIYSDNHIPYTYNIQVTVTSSAVGNVQFNVLSELMKDVADASVTVQNQSLLELVSTQRTGADGSVTFFDLPEGRYSYNISASGTTPTSGSFVIEPGVTVTVPVALEVKLISIEWSVTPVVIEDRYDIKLTQTFETNVPTPVLITEPPSINLPDIQPGQVFNGEYTVTNYGLIAVDNVVLDFPTSIGEYDIEVLTSAIPKRIKAMQKIKIPYRVTRRATLAASLGFGAVSSHAALLEEVKGFGGGGCYGAFPITVKGTAIICPNTPQQKTVDKYTTYYVTYPVPCGSGGGGGGGGGWWGYGGGWGQGGGGGFGGGIATPLPSQNPCDCKPDGSVASNGNCCFDGQEQPNNPISDLGKCPNRTKNNNWTQEYDGCTNVPDNPAAGFATAFSNPQHTGACDEHDRCYQTCSLGNQAALDAARQVCDQKLRDIAIATCASSIINVIDPLTGATQRCVAFAEIYYYGLRMFGGSAFTTRQKEVCNCCH